MSKQLVCLGLYQVAQAVFLFSKKDAKLAVSSFVKLCYNKFDKLEFDNIIINLMKMEITYPKLANLYSFIANLSQWNELTCVPQRKREWIKKTGRLNQKEKNALKDFCKIFREAQNSLELVFLFEKEDQAWTKLSKSVDKVTFSRIRSIFSIFEGRFNKIWSIDKKKIKRIAKKFILNEFTIEKISKLSENYVEYRRIKWP